MTRFSIVARGLTDSSQAGLEALNQAHTLAPQNFSYLTDYAAALLQADQPAEAIASLKRVWQENLNLTAAQRLQVALLMSDAQVARGELAEARGWLYRVLSAQSQYVPLVIRLKKLDNLLAAAAQAPAETPPAPASGTTGTATGATPTSMETTVPGQPEQPEQSDQPEQPQQP